MKLVVCVARRVRRPNPPTSRSPASRSVQIAPTRASPNEVPVWCASWGTGIVSPIRRVTLSVVTCTKGTSPSNENRCQRNAPPRAMRTLEPLPWISCSADRSLLVAYPPSR